MASRRGRSLPRPWPAGESTDMEGRARAASGGARGRGSEGERIQMTCARCTAPSRQREPR
eukprot:7969852-Pyramimonas_sp.AAC.1